MKRHLYNYCNESSLIKIYKEIKRHQAENTPTEKMLKDRKISEPYHYNLGSCLIDIIRALGQPPSASTNDNLQRIRCFKTEELRKLPRELISKTFEILISITKLTTYEPPYRYSVTTKDIDKFKDILSTDTPKCLPEIYK